MEIKTKKPITVGSDGTYKYDFGKFTPGDKLEADFEFIGIDSNNFTVSPKFGCTVPEMVIEENSAKVKFKVSRTEDFAVIVVVQNGKKETVKLKLTGHK